MKKFMSILLAAALTVSLGVTAMAADSNTGIDRVTFNKNFKLTNTELGANSPEVDFEFKLTSATYEAYAGNATVTNIPNLSYSDYVAASGTKPVNTTELIVGNSFTVHFEKGALRSATAPNYTISSSKTIWLPEYAQSGKYIYTFIENNGNVSSVAYDDTTITLTVYVTKNADGTFNRRISISKPDSTTADKVVKMDAIEFNNSYPANNLTITKVATGDAADLVTSFPVTVTLTNDTGKTIAHDITLFSTQRESVIGTVASNDWTDNSTSIDFDIMPGESVVFKGLPSGVRVKVDEDNADYYTTTYTITDATGWTVTNSDNAQDYIEGTMPDGSAEVTITNTVTAAPPTGISLDSLPYLVLLGGVAVGLAIVFLTKRRSCED